MNKQNPDVFEEDEEHQDQIPVVHVASPLDLPAEVFSSGLERRGTNRTALVKWVRDALVDGVDMGCINIGGRMSKPSLWKPGAEKICGMLGLTVIFPTLPDYEKAVLSGVEIQAIIIRCHLVDCNGNIVADVVGARSVVGEKGARNKAL